MLSPEERHHRAYHRLQKEMQYLLDARADVELSHFPTMILDTVTGEVTFKDNYTEEQKRVIRHIDELYRIIMMKFHDGRVAKLHQFEKH